MCDDCNLLKVKRPGLMAEWDYEKNKEIDINTITCGSNKKVGWVCSKEGCGHKWDAIIGNRARLNRGCPKCSNDFIDETNCLFNLRKDLMEEWDWEENEKLGINPRKVSLGNNSKVWWKCRKPECGCSWPTKISHRTYDKTSGSGCPKCSGHLIDETNCLLSIYPGINDIWAYDLNIINPKEIGPHSNELAWWRCKKCQHTFELAVYLIHIRKEPCPRCRLKFIDETNCLLTTHEKLCGEWDWVKNNEIGLDPRKIAHNCRKKAWWICPKCGRNYDSVIHNRAIPNGSGCIRCNTRYSKKCNAWLDSLGDENIQRGIFLRIPGFRNMIEADGYNPKTKTIYEFNGDEYHGNPEIHNADDKAFFGKTYGELFIKTKRKEELILKAGYTLITMWEKDWDEIVKNNKKNN